MGGIWANVLIRKNMVSNGKSNSKERVDSESYFSTSMIMLTTKLEAGPVLRVLVLVRSFHLFVVQYYRCSRSHPYPETSTVVMFASMFSHFRLDQGLCEEFDTGKGYNLSFH